MILNLKPIKTGANCFANNWVVQTCSFLGISYLPFFLRYFNDYLKIDNYSIPTLDVDPCNTMGNKYPINLLIGLKFERIDVQGDCWNYIVNEINGKIPVAISINSSELPWWEYGTQVERLMLIIGFEEDKRNFFLADGYTTTEVQKIEESNFVDQLSLYKIVINNQFVLSKHNAIKAIMHGCSQEDILKKHADMENYNNYILNNFLSMTEGESYKDLMRKPFVYALSHFVFNRKYFSKSIEFISERFSVDIFKSVSPLIQELCRGWYVYKNYLIKAALTRNIKDINTACEYFDDIKNKELVVDDRLMNSIK